MNKHRYLRFSIRSTAIGIGLIALVFGWLAYEKRSRALGEVAARKLKKLGGTLSSDQSLYELGVIKTKPTKAASTIYSRVTDWIFGEDYPSTIVDIDLSEQNNVHGMLYLLIRFRNLQSLDLSGSSVRNEDLHVVPKIVGLKRLYLADTSISDQGLEILASSKHLRTLSLSHTQITDLGLHHLSGHRRLQELDLDQTSITDDGVATLSSIVGLKILDLSSTRVTDRSIDSLIELRLTNLLLDDTNVSEGGKQKLTSRLDP